MRLEPDADWIIGRALLAKSKSIIVSPNTRGITRFFLIDAVGPAASDAGYRIGDIVTPRTVFDAPFRIDIKGLVTFTAFERPYDGFSRNVIWHARGTTIEEFTDLDGKPVGPLDLFEISDTIPPPKVPAVTESAQA